MTLKEIRQRRGLTQEELAKEVGVSIMMIQSLEAGRRKGSIETVIRLAKTLGVTTDEIIYARNNTNSTSLTSR